MNVISGASIVQSGAVPFEEEQAPLRVLHILDNLGMGGAETWLMELLKFWKQAGPGAPQLDFLATGGRPSFYDNEAEMLGANIHYVYYNRFRLPAFGRAFKDILRRGGYAAIHDHGDYISGLHYLLGNSALPPVRITHVHNPAFQIHSHYGAALSRRIAGRIGKALVACFATHIAGTSRQAISEYGFDEPHFAHIPKRALHCGFDPTPLDNIDALRIEVRREFGWPEDAQIVLFAGRIDQSPDMHDPRTHKNSGFAVSIGIEAARLDSRIRMVLVGAISPAVSELERRIAEAGLSDRIRFVGVRRDLKRLMHASDVFLFPSRGEGLGMVAVEAQAAGLPVLASTAVPRECAVVPEAIRFESLERSASDWAAAALAQLAMPHDRHAMNRRVAQSPFAIEHSARALLEMYRLGLRS